MFWINSLHDPKNSMKPPRNHLDKKTIINIVLCNKFQNLVLQYQRAAILYSVEIEGSSFHLPVLSRPFK